jgi:hypothetical protein
MTTFALGRPVRRYVKISPEAEAIIRDVYPSGGVVGTLVALADHGLPGHSSASLRKWVSKHGIKFAGTADMRPEQGDMK